MLRQQGRVAAPEQPDLRGVARLCQVLRSDTKALIREREQLGNRTPTERVGLSPSDAAVASPVVGRP